MSSTDNPFEQAPLVDHSEASSGVEGDVSSSSQSTELGATRSSNRNCHPFLRGLVAVGAGALLLGYCVNRAGDKAREEAFEQQAAAAQLLADQQIILDIFETAERTTLTPGDTGVPLIGTPTAHAAFDHFGRNNNFEPGKYRSRFEIDDHFPKDTLVTLLPQGDCESLRLDRNPETGLGPTVQFIHDGVDGALTGTYESSAVQVCNGLNLERVTVAVIPEGTAGFAPQG